MAIGYACIALGVHGTALHTCNAKNASDTTLGRVTLENLTALENLVDYNIENRIMLFRISSDIIPFGSHPLNLQNWWDDYKDRLAAIGDKIIKSGMRVSMHPGQYTILNSPRLDVVSRAFEDLIYHDRLLSAMGLDDHHKIILHIGGVYEDKPSAIQRFKETYKSLPVSIRSRLVLENDERCFSAEEVLTIAASLGAPAVFDTLHHHIKPSSANKTVREWVELFGKTWQVRDGRQKIHYAQQAEGGRPGAHAQSISLMEFLAVFEELEGLDLDVMLEVKDKNLSALKCSYTAEPELMPKTGLQKEWARYKYYILSRSADSYQRMTELMKIESKEAVREFYDLVEETQKLPYAAGTEEKAALHVWDYFKDIGTVREKAEFFRRLEKAKDSEDAGNFVSVKKHLYRMAEKNTITYLLNSYYFVL